MMLEMIYDPKNGRPLKDGDIESYYHEYISWWCGDFKSQFTKPYVVSFSTSLIFDRVRVGIAEGDFPADRVVFIFEGEKLRINKDGTLNYWPKGFLDLQLDYLTRIFDGKNASN